MYKLIAILSFLLRQFLIPNPFKPLKILPKVSIGSLDVVLTPDILNVLAGSILIPITYAFVSLFYERGSAPAWGSFLFFLFYCIHTGLIYLMSLAGFAIWVVVLVVLGYIALLVCIAAVYKRLTWRFL